jgi:hypothetical protein
MNDIAIHVENLSKRYRIGRLQSRHDTLRDTIVATLKHWRAPQSVGSGAHTLWALKDV